MRNLASISDDKDILTKEYLVDALTEINDSIDSLRNRSSVFYGTCSTAAATTEKAVTCNDFGSSDLIPGVIVNVKFGTTNSAAVANLTLNVNDTGAKSIKYVYNGNYSNIPGAAYLKADQIYQFTYDGTYWIVEMGYNTNAVPGQYYYPKMTYTALYRYMMCLTKDDRYILPVNTVSNTVATTKELTSEEFDPFGEIYYYHSTTVVAAGTCPGNTLYNGYTNGSVIDLRYSFNAGTSLVAKKDIYLACIPKRNGRAVLAPNPIRQELPTTDDGLIYIHIGQAYDTYRINLNYRKPVYFYSDGAIRLWTNSKANDLSISTEISRKRDDKKTLVVKVNGIENFKGTPKIFVYTCPRRKGTYYWRHPVDAENTVPEDPITHKKIGSKYGYASLTTGISMYGSDPDGIQYPRVPEWMPNNGYLKTEFDIPSGSDSIEILIPEWIIPLYKPNGIDLRNNAMSWEIASLMGTRRDRAPLLFKFYAADCYTDGSHKILGSANGTLAIGVRREKTLDLSDGPYLDTGDLSITELYISVR